LALEGVGQRHAPAALHDTHCIGNWLGHRADLDGCGKSRLYWVSIPRTSSP